VKCDTNRKLALNNDTGYIVNTQRRLSRNFTINKQHSITV